MGENIAPQNREILQTNVCMVGAQTCAPSPPPPPAPSTNHSLFFNKSLSNLATLLPREQRLHFRCVSCRAKSSLCWQPFNFLSCLREIHHAICKQNLSSGLSSNGASFAGIKKMRQLWSATQDSHNALNRKKPVFFKFIRPDFWTDLNGCRQRLLFARQLAQRKYSLCSQGTTLQRLKFTLTPNSKREFFPSDQVFPLFFVLLCQFYPKESFWTVFICLFSILRNSQLTFAVCRMP